MQKKLLQKEWFKKLQKLQETPLEITQLIKLLQQVNQRKKEKTNQKKTEEIYIRPENRQKIIGDLKLF